MYRLIKISTLQSLSLSPFLPREFRKCSLCNRVVAMGTTNEVRLHSTSISPLLHDGKTRKSKKRKKYIELLEVKDTSTSQTKAKVKNINADNLSLIAEYENKLQSLTSEKGFKLEEEEAEGMLEELEEMQGEGQSGQGVLLEAMPLNSKKVQNAVLADADPSETTQLKSSTRKKSKMPRSLKKETREKLAKVKQSELDKAGREKSLSMCLLNYLELCVNCGFMNRAWITFQFYTITRKVAINNHKIYEVLMEGFAKSGNVERVQELLKLMLSHDIRPSHKAFAHLLEGVARSSKLNKFEMIQEAFRHMESQGVTCNDLFVMCRWKGDTRDVVLGAIRAARPNFAPVVPPPNLNYSNPLLLHLNKVDISNLRSPAAGVINKEELNNLFQRQLQLESDYFIKVKSIEKTSQENIEYYREKLEESRKNWEKSITNAVKRDLSAMSALQKNLHKMYKQVNIFPYLSILDKNEFRNIIMHEIQKLAEGSETFGPPVSQLYRELGHQVRIRYEIKIKRSTGLTKKLESIYEQYSKWYLDPSASTSANSRQEWQTLVHRHIRGPSIELELSPWPQTVLYALGKFLYNIILRDIKIDVNILKKSGKTPHYLPAFYSVFRNQGHINKEEVKPHPVLARLMRAAASQTLTFNVTEIPMVIPPVPWSSLNCGGNLLAKTHLIRLPHQAIQQWERLSEAPPSQLYPLYDSLNQLGSVPWRVNKPVLDLVICIFNDGGNAKLDVPETPSVCPLPEPITSDMSKTERFQVYQQRMILRRKKAEMYSLWCDALYRLSLANHFRDQIFWLPHNMDFRGRVYPCPPHLNHLGSDMARSLLEFAKGEPLGNKGLDWLKIHLVNLTGLKKRDSIKDRLAYANEILEDILDSANNPLDGKMWWTKSEEPWQTLACCMEIRNALASPEGPENFISHYPIHQDGSCNGLQHYAALGRDSAGAFSVNLAPSDVPQDVYSCVAALVERERAKDAANGVQLAQVLDGFVRRKVIKQTVMTTVYGVTRFGARLQIAKQLKDIDDFPKDYIWPASTYLVVKTFSSLREMFTSTREIQDWFTESARMISQVCGQNVEYVTPLGLPVVQPYHRPKPFEKRVGSSISEHFAIDMFERPNVMKQKNAFPPNFIHSLDSTHMMLTSINCERAGITFVSVHDCYWTHPCSVEIMNKICREQFVVLHSQPILQSLSDFLLQKFSYKESDILDEPENLATAKQRLNDLLRDMPARGDFQLEKVLDSVYFFS